jgi:hypothetical protein
VGSAGGGGGDMACVDEGAVLVQSRGPRVVITAKHVQLAAAGDDDLATLLLHRCVCGGGVLQIVYDCVHSTGPGQKGEYYVCARAVVGKSEGGSG